jgi:heme-degrading monooxygenase HmoA
MEKKEERKRKIFFIGVFVVVLIVLAFIFVVLNNVDISEKRFSQMKQDGSIVFSLEQRGYIASYACEFRSEEEITVVNSDWKTYKSYKEWQGTSRGFFLKDVKQCFFFSNYEYEWKQIFSFASDPLIGLRKVK